MRKNRVFSIDPADAKDLDDAISIEKVSESTFKIGVHIADVSYFVTQGSDLDNEALKRGCSTYFAHKVFPMLPKRLSEELCSLHANQDKLTYSIEFQIHDSGSLDESFEPVISRSVIRSQAQLNYEEV